MVSSGNGMFRNHAHKLFLLLILAGCTAGSVSNSDDDIRMLLDMQVDAWNNGDVEGYMTGYWHSDSTIFVSGGNKLSGYDSVLARYKRSYPNREAMGQLTFKDLEIIPLSKDASIARGIWRLERKADEPWGRFTLLIERKAEGWRIVYDHTSSAG